MGQWGLWDSGVGRGYLWGRSGIYVPQGVSMGQKWYRVSKGVSVG